MRINNTQDNTFTERLSVIGDISSNDSLLARNNLITGGPLSKISGRYSTAEGFSVVIGNNSHAEGFYCGVIGTGGHAEGSRSFVGLRYTYSAYTAATRTLTFSPAVTANMDLYASFTPGTSAIFYSTVPVRFEPVVIESRDSSTGSIVLTKDVAGINISSSTRFLVLPGINGGTYGHAEGYETRVSGDYSHAEGRGSWADGSGSHAEGFSTAALGYYSHAEGTATDALGDSSHAEGYNTIASGNYSHAAGVGAEAAQDFTYAWSDANLNTYTNNISTTRTGQYMVSASGGIFFPGNVGIGTDNNNFDLYVRKNSVGATPEPNSIAVFEGGGNAHISILTPDAQTGGVVFGSPSDNFGSYLTWNYSNNALKLATAKTNGFIQLLTDNEAEAVRITSSGNVGIGTTVPAEKLTVNGSISSNGSITVLGGNSNQWNTAANYFTTYPLLTTFYYSPLNLLGGTTNINLFNVPTGKIFIAKNLTILVIDATGSATGVAPVSRVANASRGDLALTNNNTLPTANCRVGGTSIAQNTGNTTASGGEIVAFKLTTPANNLTTLSASAIVEGYLI
jgi:hypothetical protein